MANLKTAPHLATMLANSEGIPPNFVAIGPADHPTKPGATGMLARNRGTGLYVLLVAGACVSVPRKWASNVAAEMGKGADAIQDACIAQMEAMGLNPNRVAELVGDAVSRTHVCDYLSRRSSMGSHKLQHLMPVLKINLTPSK